MKLRTRLFIIVGALFLVAFGISFAVEEYFTRTNLEQAQHHLEEEILRINEMKRQHYETFLKREVSRAEARIDAVLAKIAYVPHLRKGFAPNNENKDHKTWLNTASLKITNPWIDFVQNLDEGDISASILVDELKHDDMRYAPINDSLILAGIKRKTGGWEGPFIGVKIEYDFGNPKEIKLDSMYYALFTPEALRTYNQSSHIITEVDISLNFLNPFIQWIEVPSRRSFMKELLERVQEAKTYVQKETATSGLAAWKKRAVAQIEAYKKNDTWRTPGDEHFDSFLGANDDDLLKTFFRETVTTYDKVGMTWGLSTLIASGAFGYSPYGPNSPSGIGHVFVGKPVAEGLLTDEVFLKKPIVPTSSCVKKQQGPYCLETNLQVFPVREDGLVFLGNTLEMSTGDEVGSLSIGIDSQRFLQDIARAADDTTAFVSGGEIVQIVDAMGDPIEKLQWKKLPVQRMLREKTGTVELEGKEFFYLHVVPFHSMDIHFFIFKLKSVEFELLNNINKASKDLIQKISHSVRLAGLLCLALVLILLHYIARSITRPITKLAIATKAVAKGNLNEIETVSLREKRKDEISSLYHSFLEMVEGLKEKEKVRGVLNKVVSPQVAKEALSGEIHLGGEEREVTVLFGDVRNFTTITEKMKPSEVVEMLNLCMTKISNLVDEHGGVIDKYVGDEVMALFGAPVAQEDAAQKAVDAALEMIAILQEWNKERKEKGLPVVEMGFGIHTGMVLAGNMGAENRLNYTVLGSGVNFASRLCSIAKPNEILVSKGTFEKLQKKDHLKDEEVTSVELKGFTQDFTIHKITRA